MICDDFFDVQKEYGKNKELKREDIKMLQEWMDKQPHLPKATELELILFLHSCYYRIEATKACIETFYTARTHCPEFFQNRNPKTNSAEILDTLLYVPLPKPSAQGYQVLFGKLLNCDPDKYVLSQQIKTFDMSAMLMLHQLGTAPGHVLLIDMKGCTFAHITRINPVQLKKFFVYLQEGMPIRLKAMYFINIPSFMDKLLALIKPLMKKELLETMQLFTDKLDDLYKIIPQECFPADYGGKADPINQLTKTRNENFLKHEQFFVEGESQVSDESERIGKPKDAGDIFGVDGTFKKLDYD